MLNYQTEKTIYKKKDFRINLASSAILRADVIKIANKLWEKREREREKMLHLTSIHEVTDLKGPTALHGIRDDGGWKRWAEEMAR